MRITNELKRDNQTKPNQTKNITMTAKLRSKLTQAWDSSDLNVDRYFYHKGNNPPQKNNLRKVGSVIITLLKSLTEKKAKFI